MSVTAVTINIGPGVPRPDLHAAAHTIRRRVREALANSPHEIVSLDTDVREGGSVTVAIETEDEANASTLIHEAMADVKVAEMPARTIND